MITLNNLARRKHFRILALTLTVVMMAGIAPMATADSLHYLLGIHLTGGAASPPAAGGGFPWEGIVGGVNTATGNKQTAYPLVSWTARGSLPVNVTLYHNSQATADDCSGFLGEKWRHSYEICLTFDGSDNATIHWGDGTHYEFENDGGTYTAPTGIHESLVKNGTPATSFDLTTKSQVKYHFTKPYTAWVCTTISDTNSNTITISYHSNNSVYHVTDPGGRQLTFSYYSNHLAAIDDPLERTWVLNYTQNGNDDKWDLTSIDLPAVTEDSTPTAHSVYYEYDVSDHHNIATYTDTRGKDWTFTYNNADAAAPRKPTHTRTRSATSTTIRPPRSPIPTVTKRSIPTPMGF